MRVNNTNSSICIANLAEKNRKSRENSFSDTLLDKMNSEKDSYIVSNEEAVYQCENYNGLYYNAIQKAYAPSIKPVETARYLIEEKEGGFLRIFDKERNEGFNWKLNENQIQVDKATGNKFLINDLGVGFFNMVTVDAELETGIKESLGVEKLEEKELTGFTVHQDQKTGIQYITANGYESRGGLIVFTKEAIGKLDSLAKNFQESYPNLAKSYNEAWFYASFEVRGLLKRTTNGIMMISPNSITFKNGDGINGWVCIFDPKNWYQVKSKFDKNENLSMMEEWGFWNTFFENRKIDASLLEPDFVGGGNVNETIRDSQFRRFISLCYF